MPDLLHEPSLDNSLAFLSEGHTYISRRCGRFGSDLFTTRIMLTPVVCMRGAEAARIFYEEDRFTRRSAMPQTTLRLLQDKGSVQMLDGDPHRRRKRMHMSLVPPEAIERIADLPEHRWREALHRWGGMDEVVLLPEVGSILTRVACDWAGVPLAEEDAPELTRELEAMIEQAGSIGPATLAALRLRRRTERRMRRLVERIRAGEETPPEGSAAATIARHADDGEEPLDSAIAAGEIINILRPTVAVGRFIVFAALALNEHPVWRERLAADDGDLEPFVQEVRRFYPFFPSWEGGRCAPSSGAATVSRRAIGRSWTFAARTATPGSGRSPNGSGPSASGAGRATPSP